jgi:hypothetical protein
MVIFTGHQPEMDEPVSIEYEYNPSNSSGVSETHIRTDRPTTFQTPLALSCSRELETCISVKISYEIFHDHNNSSYTERTACVGGELYYQEEWLEWLETVAEASLSISAERKNFSGTSDNICKIYFSFLGRKRQRAQSAMLMMNKNTNWPKYMSRNAE